MAEYFHARWQRVDYASLDGRQQEARNFHKMASVLADYGFDCFRIPTDWRGADLLAHHVPSGRVLRVQLKSALTINKKYESQGDLWIAFPVDRLWHLAPHADLVRAVGEATAGKALRNRSWMTERDVFWQKPTKALLEAIVPFQMGVG